MPHTLIAPSILAADFARLGEEIEAIDKAGCDWVHLDVMDGHFVPNISFGPAVIKALRSRTAKPFDVHLMIEPYEPYLEAFAEAGADAITVHIEAGHHIHRTLRSIRSLGKRAGVAINPGTPARAVEGVLDDVDLIIVMTVNPGFGGQSFIPSQLDKIRTLRTMVGGRDIIIEADGGVGPNNAAQIIAAGAGALVAGSSVFRHGAPDDPDGYRKAIQALRTPPSN